MQGFLDYFSENKDAIIALGVFIAALTSVFGVIWGNRSAHSSHVALLRVGWIESLREAVGNYLQLIASLNVEAKLRKDKTVNTISDDYREVHRLLSKIELMLNPNEEEHEKLLSLIFEYKYLQDMQKFSSKRMEIRRQFAVVTKQEWRRVKRGE